MGMVVRVPKSGHRTLPINLDFGEDDETMVRPEDKNKVKGSRRSKGSLRLRFETTV